MPLPKLSVGLTKSEECRRIANSSEQNGRLMAYVRSTSDTWTYIYKLLNLADGHNSNKWLNLRTELDKM